MTRFYWFTSFLICAFPCSRSGNAEEDARRAPVWRLGNSQAIWTISKTTGQVLGGWNAKTGERYLEFLEGRYHLEDRKSLVTGRESADKIMQAEFLEKRQRVELTCSNPAVPDLTISKQYWVDGNKLYLRTAFETKSPRMQFLTCNYQAAFVPDYRDGGYYMGGGDGGGPLVPAPRISEWQKVLQYQNTTKGMLLSQPEKGYSFAHIRTRLDGRFVWPWFTGAIASYVERMNVMHYTPDGWDMSLGTSRLSTKRETSYEQYLSLFKGDWQRFLRSEYSSLPQVQQALREIPPVPDWVSGIKMYAGADMQRLRRMVKMTDEGTILAMIVLSGSWADYYVERGIVGGYGGRITGPELRDWIQRIKALSPRIKVGLYMWVLSTTDQTRIYHEHPNWFRYGSKDGEPLSTFPGFWPNFAHLLSVPGCYKAILSQFDHVLSYLGTDYVYLDDPKAINMIDWRSGEYTRDDLSFKFFLDLKRLVARHGPDKVVFFNNRGNPYGDINFIEARAQLRANYWRRFTGIGAVCQEFVASTRPKARIIPLYFTPPMKREYLNRVLALGWIPSLTYCDVIASRPFFQAAYEVGNCAPVPARYSPDWKRDRKTRVESYAVQRYGDKGAFLSFINHAEKEETVPIRIDIDSLKLSRTERLFVWEYVVENALEFKGSVTERLARKAYARTGWQLDRVTRRRLLYAGPYRNQIEFKVRMEPLLLTQLYLTTQPVAVYSEDNLPANYLFSQMPNVKLDARADWANGSVDIRTDSNRNEAEVIVFLPLRTHALKSVYLDGQPVEPALVCEGEDIFPVIKVRKGRHRLALTFASVPESRPMAVKSFSAAEALLGISVDLPGYDGALLTIEKDGHVMFNRMGTGKSGRLLLPIAPALGEAATYTVLLRAVIGPRGRILPVKGVRSSLELAAASPDLGLGPDRPPTASGQREIHTVNRKIKGLEILRSAIMTTPTIPGDAQPELKSLTAEVLPGDLVLEAGTTRTILQGPDGRLGAAFAGLEIRNLRKVQLKLTNTFANAFHMRGPGHHVPDRPNSRNFAGIVIDYHTPGGYTKRVRIAVGVLHPECNSAYPDYGRSAVADESRDLGPELIETREKTFALDLRQYGPEGWDGQVWLSVGCDWIAPDRRLRLQVLAVNDAVSGHFLSGTDPKAFRAAYNKPRILRVPRSPGGIIIDGAPDEEMWRGAATSDQFFLYGGKGISRAKTTSMLLYDDKNLYIAFTCEEPDRRRPRIIGGPAWDDDEVEVWIDANGDQKTFRQVILNAANEKLEYGQAGPTPIGATAAVHIVEGASWMVEMAIPFKGLGVDSPKPGDIWRLSLCRGRPPGKKNPNHELIVWAPLRTGGFNDLANFGTLLFR